MRLPRDISGEDLARLLKRLWLPNYASNGEPHAFDIYPLRRRASFTIPRHKSLRVGTLSGILKDISDYLDIGKEELIRELFSDE